MELRQYWNVIWKRRWLVLGVIVLVAIISAVMFLTTGKSYRADVHFTSRWDPPVNTPVPGSDDYMFASYYNWLSNEYLVDDYTKLITTQVFGQDVLNAAKQELAAGRPQGIVDSDKLTSDLGKLKAQDVVDYIATDRSQRILRVSFGTPSKDLTLALLNASAIVITSGPIEPIRGAIKDRPLFGQYDFIDPKNVQSNTSRDLTNAIVRIVLGIVAAVALAFFLEYLDRSVRDERDAARVLEMPVLGRIPRV